MRPQSPWLDVLDAVEQRLPARRRLEPAIDDASADEPEDGDAPEAPADEPPEAAAGGRAGFAFHGVSKPAPRRKSSAPPRRVGGGGKFDWKQKVKSKLVGVHDIPSQGNLLY